MNQTWIAVSAAAEDIAQHKQIAEEFAHQRFIAARAQLEAAGKSAQVIDSVEFHCWMTARHETDEAWGAWAMAMDAKPTT